ncbi:MAG: hypoxanthine phosphoribosyltransferase [Victivallaceae bacterium]|nr:hypoxanthine phosphoribosyltransferase [Victivallaceae bacterium]
MKLLYSRDAIASRVAEMGKTITAAYQGKPLTVVVLLNGAMLFGADLIRKIELPIHVDTLAVSSYRKDFSSGEVVLRGSLKLPVGGRHILLVDDILDTGTTLAYLCERFRNDGALSIKTCVLLDKMRKESMQIEADFRGFEIPDRYVIGYGLDSEEEYRNLPDIYVK